MKVLQKIFKHKEPTEYVEIRSIAMDNSKAIDRLWITDIDEAQKFIESHKDTNNVYFGVTGKSRKSGKKDSFSTAYCLWADLDNTTVENFPAFWLPPSLVVISGTGLHVYWMLQEPCKDANKVEQVNKRIASVIGGDSVFDVSRILRIDGTFNHKRGNNEPVTVVYDKETSYTIEELNSACGLKATYHTLANTRGKGIYISRSEKDMVIMKESLRLNFSDQTIRHMFDYLPSTDKHRSEPGYFEKTLKSAKNLIAEEVRNTNNILNAFNKISTPQNGVIKNEKPEEPESKSRFQKVKPEKDDTPVEVKNAVHGIYAYNCKYYKIVNKGTKKEIHQELSTFEFKLSKIVKGNALAEDVFVGNLCSPDGLLRNDFSLDKRTFNSRSNFISAIPDTACSWYGNDQDIQAVMQLINSSITPDMIKQGVSQIGYHKGYWIGDNQLFLAGHNLPISEDKCPYNFIPQKSASITVNYAVEQPEKKDIKKFADYIFRINQEDIIYPLMGWWCASLFKSRFTKADSSYKFPILNVFGTKGSGKTATMEILQKLSGYDTPKFTVSTASRFVLYSLLNETKDVMVSLTEYRNSFLHHSSNNLIQYLLTLYDGGYDSRGTKNLSIVQKQLSSPVTVDGEDGFDDPALINRSIQLNFSKSEMTKARQLAFQKLQDVDLKAIGTEIIKYSLDKNFDIYLQKAKNLCAENKDMDVRTRNNIEVVIAGVMFLSDFLKNNINATIQPDCGWFDPMLESSETKEILADRFITDVSNYCNRLNWVSEYADFKFKVSPEENILWFNLTDAVSWWRTSRNKQQRDSMELKAIKSQLKERIDTYIIPSKNIKIDSSSVWCIGINLQQASDFGLEVPVQVTIKSLYDKLIK